VFSHARQLLGEEGTLAEQMTVHWGTYLAHSMRAEHSAALEVARQCLALAARHEEHPGMAALANRFTGQTLNFMGALDSSRLHLERTLALCAAHQETIATYRKFGSDDQVMALSFLGSTLLLLGYPEQAATAVGKALSRARALRLVYPTALALNQVALLGTLGCDQMAAVHAEEFIALSIEHGLTDLEQRARFLRGALLAQGGDPQQGIELMRSAMAAADSKAARYYRRTIYLGHLASAHASLGQRELALSLLDEAIRTAETTNELFFEAELHRLRGKVLLNLDRRAEAEAALQRALNIAEQQHAHWWQLRAATDLARLWQDAGKCADAYRLLQPIFAWFVEGFDTPDLRDAKGLLDELMASGTQT
jgi:tetratricopeptide (TPR) repeat protein